MNNSVISHLNLELKPSRIFWVLSFLIHVGAIIIIWCLALPISLALIITLLCLLSWWFTNKNSITILAEKNDHSWYLQDKHGKVYSGTLRGDSIRTRYCVLLNFTIPNGRFMLPVLIWRDTIDTDSFRHLKVCLTVTSQKTDE